MYHSLLSLSLQIKSNDGLLHPFQLKLIVNLSHFKGLLSLLHYIILQSLLQMKCVLSPLKLSDILLNDGHELFINLIPQVDSVSTQIGFVNFELSSQLEYLFELELNVEKLRQLDCV